MKVPAAVKELKLPERRLAWGLTTDGVPLVATPSALHTPDSQLRWTDVEKVSWKPSTLLLTEVSELEGAGTQHRWELAEDNRLAETIRARVTSSIGWSDRRALHPSGHVRLVGRRVPEQDALVWQLVFETGTNPYDENLRAQAERMVEALRRTIG